MESDPPGTTRGGWQKQIENYICKFFALKGSDLAEGMNCI